MQATVGSGSSPAACDRIAGVDDAPDGYRAISEREAIDVVARP